MSVRLSTLTYAEPVGTLRFAKRPCSLGIWTDVDGARWDTRSAWDVARDGIAELAHRNLVKSYPARVEPQWAVERRAA